MAYTLLGKDFVPPDIHAKVTGAAKYAEDFKVDGMLYARLLTSPIPHARVRDIRVSAAMEIEGVVAVLTADDVPPAPNAQNPILTNNPRYVGDPILAVAAVSEQIAEDAIAAIEIEFEQLPFTTDPLDSLRPGGSNGHIQGNIGNSTLQEEIRHATLDRAGLRGGRRQTASGRAGPRMVSWRSGYGIRSGRLRAG